MWARLRSAFPSLVGLVLFLVALAVLRRELDAVSWQMLTRQALATPVTELALALLLTALNYAALTGYDFIAFAYVGRSLPRWRVAIVSFLAYAIANNVGFAMLSGASVRYRYYTRWGIGAEELARIIFSCSVTFWLGLFALGGLSLSLGALPDPSGDPWLQLARPIGWLLMAVGFGYVALTMWRREPLRLGRFALPLPPARLAAAQLVVSAVDWALAGAVLYVLLPPSGASFLVVLSAFLAAQLLGLASHVPGGVGVFEGLMVILLKPFLGSAELLPALILYRVIYYLLPLSIALLVLVVDELRRYRSTATRVTAWLGRASELVTPRLLAVFTFIGGLILLFSGATPAAEGRLALLGRALPLGIIETSHFVGSLAGVFLLLLSQGLSRRLDSAWLLTVAAVSTGIATSLLKGGDYEEALLLALLLGVLWRARPAFDRRAAIFETTFPLAWTASVLAAVVSSVWLGLFAFKHVEYSDRLWWQFALDGDVSRFLRASVGVAVAVIGFALLRLLRPAHADPSTPDADDLARAAEIIARDPSTSANLVFLRDKALVWNDDRTAFVMYAVQGRTWVALGDPVGPCGCAAPLIRRFLERCDDFDGLPVFYQVGQHRLHQYADFGLTFVKLGEEARVTLDGFSLEGADRAKLRHAVRRLEREGAAFRVVPPAEVQVLLPQLEAVSTEWLTSRAAAEKGFSLGFFDRDYLARFPCAVIEVAGQVVAFANLWPGGTHDELSIDLMRHRDTVPNGVMDALIANIMLWGRAQGYRQFVLGMAPLAGLESSEVAPLWARVGRWIARHGETLYNFRGLRSYKEKFDPVWEARYLAYPGGLALPRILADVSALIAGGYGRVFLNR
jgi:phosphatidylglycerol lysyltransferase